MHQICDLIGQGRSLASICDERADLPQSITIRKWLAEDDATDDKKLVTMYVRAREDAADHLAEEIVSIADEAPLSNEAIAKARLRMDARKWVAAKLKPRRYGDNVQQTVEVSGTVQHSLAVSFVPVEAKAIPLKQEPTALIVDAEHEQIDY